MLDKEIDKLLNTGVDIKNEIIEVDTCNESIIAAKIKMQNKIKSIQVEQTQSVETRVNRAVSSVNENKTAKLPRCEIQ